MATDSIAAQIEEIQKRDKTKGLWLSWDKV
jgi:hypothetical protein